MFNTDTLDTDTLDTYTTETTADTSQGELLDLDSVGDVEAAVKYVHARILICRICRRIDCHHTTIEQG
jgi:hypothetical protein